MNNSMTFRQLETPDGGRSEPDPNNSPLDEWYCRVRDTPISEFADEDLGRACRQAIYVDHIVPIAVARLEEEPLAGDMYDGELLVAMRSIPVNYWRKDQQTSERLLKVVERVKQLSDDQDIIHDVDELVGRIVWER
jgi:hypothetical protein